MLRPQPTSSSSDELMQSAKSIPARGKMLFRDMRRRPCVGDVFDLCPHHKDAWHKTIREKHELIQRQSHPESYRKELTAEITTLTALHASEVRNDLVGDPDLAQRLPVLRTGGSLRVCTVSTFRF